MFQWKEAYCIDGGTVDKEHQHLFELANRVLAFKDPIHQVDAVKQAIHDVYDYIEYHFDHEEELMLEAEYPGYVDHAQKHKDIIHEMNTILKNCYDIKLFAVEFKQLMAKWVVHHIIEEDTKIAPYMKASVGTGESFEVQ